jgi:hypothetical protein
VPSRSCIACVCVAPHVALLYPVVEGTTCTASCSAGLARGIQPMNEDMRKHVFGNVSIHGPARAITDCLCQGGMALKCFLIMHAEQNNGWK